MTKPREIFRFNPPIQIKGSWTTSLTDLEVYDSSFIKTEEKKEFELYTAAFDEFSFEELKDELEENLNISDITPHHPQHEKIGARNI